MKNGNTETVTETLYYRLTMDPRFRKENNFLSRSVSYLSSS